MTGETPWFCAGNLPTPWSTLEELKAFLIWAEPRAGELLGLDADVESAKARIHQLEATLPGETPDPSQR